MRTLYSFQTPFSIYQQPQCNTLQDLSLQLSRCWANTSKFDEYQDFQFLILQNNSAIAGSKPGWERRRVNGWLVPCRSIYAQQVSLEMAGKAQAGSCPA